MNVLGTVTPPVTLANPRVRGEDLGIPELGWQLLAELGGVVRSWVSLT